jgi:hypothetical protein
MSPNVFPVAKAVYLCDDVVYDSSSGKIHLVGLLNSVRLDEGTALPFHLGKLCVFAQLIDGLGAFAAHVEIVNADTGELIYRTAERTLSFPSRTRLVYANFRILDCSFPQPGIYLVELYCGDQFVDDRQLRVRLQGDTSDE